MGCNCKNAVKINDANATEISLFRKALLFSKKISLLILAIMLAIVITPIVIVAIIYKMIFKPGEGIIIPDKILKMLK